MIFTIAEAACNHLGDMEKARDMIDSACECSADAVKFQAYITEKINDPSLHEFLKKARFDEVQHKELKSYSQEKGIEYMCSAFDVESIEMLERIGVRRHKIPSGQVHNTDYLKAMANTGKPVIMSTGMCIMDDVRKAVDVLASDDLTIMHCITAYPAPDIDTNLYSIIELRKEFPNAVIGYSDHTMRSASAMIAVALGVKVVEHHFALSSFIKTPDIPVSFNPAEFYGYVLDIQLAEEMLGDGIKKVEESERKNLHRRDYSLT